jgi:hypothetical protein
LPDEERKAHEARAGRKRRKDRVTDGGQAITGGRPQASQLSVLEQGRERAREQLAPKLFLRNQKQIATVSKLMTRNVELCT